MRRPCHRTPRSGDAAESLEKEHTCLARRRSASELETCLLPLKAARCTGAARGDPATDFHHGYVPLLSSVPDPRPEHHRLR
eukprot:8742412-Pyramimonas_sp.AAC.1